MKNNCIRLCVVCCSWVNKKRYRIF